MGEEASFNMFFEKDDAKLPRKRKALIRHEEIQGSAEFVSKVEQY